MNLVLALALSGGGIGIAAAIAIIAVLVLCRGNMVPPNDTLEDIRDAWAPAGVLPGGFTKRSLGAIPSTATPFVGVSAVITSVTPVAVRAAVTSKKKWITKIVACNPTPAEQAVIIVEDDTAVTPLKLALLQPGDPAIGGSGHREFVCDPPIEVASGKAINARAHASLGDSFVMCEGFEEA